MKPYVYVAPSFGLTMPMGNIQQFTLDKKKSLNQSVAIDSCNMAPYDIGFVAGVGVHFMIDFDRFSLAVKMEAGYNYGLMDTYSLAEHHDQAQSVNVNAYNVLGKRLNRGLEASVTVAIPLKILPGDACSGFTNKSRTRHRLGTYGF